MYVMAVYYGTEVWYKNNLIFNVMNFNKKKKKKKKKIEKRKCEN